MSLPLILVVVVIIRSLPVPGSQFHNEAPAITFQPYKCSYTFEQEVAEGFFRAKNYSNAYFMFYIYVRRRAGTKMRKKAGTSMSDKDALELAAERQMFGLDRGLSDEFRTGAAMAVGGRRIKRRVCLAIRSAAKRLS